MARSQQNHQIVKETSCFGRRTCLEKVLFALCFLATIAILALGISLYMLNLRGERNSKLARAEPLRYARSQDPSRTYLPVQAIYPENPQNTSTASDVESSSENVRTVIGVEDAPEIPQTYLDGTTEIEPQQRPTYETPAPTSNCETPGCVAAASKITSYIDESLDPCDNFYNFACGSYLRNTELPDVKVTVDAFSDVRDLVEEQLRIILNEPPQPDDSKTFLLAKRFHASCLNQEINEERGVKPLVDMLEAFGGWPVLKGDLWSEGSFNWVESIKKFRRMGLDTYVMFALNAETNLKNSSERVLVIDQGSHELGQDFLVKGVENEQVKSYLKFMVDAAVLLGANATIAEQELKEALEFEIKLAEIAYRREDRRNASALYHPFTIKQLQESYPYMDWLDFMNGMMPFGFQIYENETIINTVPKFFEKLGDLINSSPKRAISNYLLWRVVFTTSGSLNADLLKTKLDFYKAVYGFQGLPPRWKECITLTNEQLPISVGALYIRKFFNEESRSAAIDLVEDVRHTFIDSVKVLPWMDEVTREEATKKAKAITTHIGYPNELADINELEKYYKDIEIETDNLLLNTLRLTAFYFDRSLNKLREPVNKTDWEAHSTPATVGATYKAKENAIIFPAAIFQDRFFSSNRPRFMNYASIGSVIGHEITHGFDDQGKQFDLDGNLNDWWDSETQKQFLDKAKCIIDQYGNYTDIKANLTLNGINTQGENIADNGGTKGAYYAYANWVQRNGAEGKLPGLKYNQQQLFWITFANMRCSVSRDSFIVNQITTGVHAPNEHRINGVVSNLPEFAYDFNCPLGTKMNPSNKCAVW